MHKVLLYYVGFYICTMCHGVFSPLHTQIPTIKPKMKDNGSRKTVILNAFRDCNNKNKHPLIGKNKILILDNDTKSKSTLFNDMQRLRKIKRVVQKGVALGIGASSAVPLMNDIVDFTYKYDTLQSKLDSVLTHSNINPKDYTTKLECKGDEWSYSTLMQSLNEKTIDGMSIHQDGKFAIIIDAKHMGQHRPINPYDLHHVTTIPLHINDLIQRLILNDINFDVI